MHIVGVVGKKTHGKDAVAEAVKAIFTNHEVVRLAFADPLYMEISKAFGIPIERIRADKARWRVGLQWWGTDIRRHYQGDDYWIKRWLNEINNIVKGRPAVDDKLVIVAPDCRFLNEAAAIRFAGGMLLRVIRPGQPTDSDAHASETEQDKIEVDATILNNTDLPGLQAATRHVFKQLGLRYATT